MSVEKLARELAAAPSGAVERFLASCDPAEHAAVEAALAFLERERTADEFAAADWRATPATMAHHLSGGQRRLWRYVELLGRRFRSAFAGLLGLDERCDPKQIWMLPSQMGKTSSLMAGVVWALDHDPRLRIMYVSYDANKAVEEAGNTRDLVLAHSADLRFDLRPDRRARGLWRTEEGGGLYAVGIYGGITGYPADAIELDDLFKGWQTAHSETERNNVWNIYTSQVRMRAQRADTPIVCAGTRWHEDDIPARLRAAADADGAADQWTVLRLPAVAEPAEPAAIDPLLRDSDPLGREPGEVIEPDRFAPAEVAARGAALGPYLRAGLEQQRPAPPEGNDIKREWFRLSDSLPADPDEAITSWDLKLKDREAGDWVVGGTWLRAGGGYWLVDVLRGQWDQPTVEVAVCLAEVRARHRGWQVRMHVLENTGNAPEVMAALRRPQPGYEVTERVVGLLGMSQEEAEQVAGMRRRGVGRLHPEPVKGDKRVRMRTHSGLLESGHVHLWASAPWLPAYIEELVAFPNGAHDDQVDMTSQALKHLSGVGPASISSSAARQLPPTPIGRDQTGGSFVGPRRASVRVPTGGGLLPPRPIRQR